MGQERLHGSPSLRITAANGHSGKIMSKLSISKAWDETKAILGRDGKLFATVAAALFLLPQALAGLAAGQSTTGAPPGGWAGLLLILAAIVGLVGQLAVVRLALDRTSVGEAIRHGFRRLPIFLLALILVVIAVTIVFFLLALLLIAVGVIDSDMTTPSPRAVGIIILILLPLMLFLAVRMLPLVAVVGEERPGPIEALTRSWRLSGGHGWRLLGFLLAFILGALVLTLVVGLLAGLIIQLFFGAAEPFTLGALVLALFTGVAQAAVSLVYVMMIARIYAQLAGPRTEEVAEVFR